MADYCFVDEPEKIVMGTKSMDEVMNNNKPVKVGHEKAINSKMMVKGPKGSK